MWKLPNINAIKKMFSGVEKCFLCAVPFSNTWKFIPKSIAPRDGAQSPEMALQITFNLFKSVRFSLSPMLISWENWVFPFCVFFCARECCDMNSSVKNRFHFYAKLRKLGLSKWNSFNHQNVLFSLRLSFMPERFDEELIKLTLA